MIVEKELNQLFVINEYSLYQRKTENLFSLKDILIIIDYH